MYNLLTRRKKLKRVASGGKEVSVNVKTKNTFKYQMPTNLKNFGQIREIELLHKFPIMSHSARWVINPPQKHHHLFFAKPP